MVRNAPFGGGGLPATSPTPPLRDPRRTPTPGLARGASPAAAPAAASPYPAQLPPLPPPMPMPQIAPLQIPPQVVSSAHYGDRHKAFCLAPRSMRAMTVKHARPPMTDGAPPSSIAERRRLAARRTFVTSTSMRSHSGLQTQQMCAC